MRYSNCGRGKHIILTRLSARMRASHLHQIDRARAGFDSPVGNIFLLRTFLFRGSPCIRATAALIFRRSASGPTRPRCPNRTTVSHGLGQGNIRDFDQFLAFPSSKRDRSPPASDKRQGTYTINSVKMMEDAFALIPVSLSFPYTHTLYCIKIPHPRITCPFQHAFCHTP
jgi:hypothetical protein